MSVTKRPHLVIIGGGATGTGIAREAARRGYTFTLIERGSLGSGTSGRFHGMLHSGARYAVNDPAVAAECFTENRRLRQLMPSAITDTGGLFVALDDEEAEHGTKLLEACRAAGVPCKEVTAAQAHRLEPNLTKVITRAFTVPDGFIDGAALLRLNRAAAPGKYLTDTVVTGFTKIDGRLTGVSVKRGDGSAAIIKADYVINAAGIWAGQVAGLADQTLEMLFDKGIMIIFKGALNTRVLNRCRPESDGDLLVPHAGTSIMGTTARVVRSPEDNLPSQEEADILLHEGAAMVPLLEHAEATRIYAGIRPLLRPNGQLTNVSTRSVSRSFNVIPHETYNNMLSVVGGKVTLHRLMAEATLNAIEG